MTEAVVFGLAVADGLAPVVGAAPYEVLARQLPRLLVARLNGAGDRGVRFFPFLGNQEGKRTFLLLKEPLAAETLSQLHRQGDVRCLVDGAIGESHVRLRIHDGESLRPLLDAELPFDPRRPLEVLQRAQFEVMGALGWEGPPSRGLVLGGEALAWYLVAKDQLLALEANLLDAADPLRAARRCVELAAQDDDVQEVVLDHALRLLRHDRWRGEVADVLAKLGERTPFDVRAQTRIGSLLQACGDETRAAESWLRAARANPTKADVVERAAALLFRQDRLVEAREVLQAARSRKAITPAALGQLAAVCDRQGDRIAVEALLSELLQLKELPLAVSRLVLTLLLEAERAAEARAIAEAALRREPDNAQVVFDHARACLLLDDGPAAAPSFRRAIELGLPAEQRREAERLLRLCSVRGLWAAVQRTENALKNGDGNAAVRAAREIVRTDPESAEGWLLLGIVRHRLQHLERAELALRHAAKLDPTCGEAFNRLGILLVGDGRVTEGHDHLLHARELSPLEPAPLLHLAQSSVLLGRRAEGLLFLEQAEKLGASPATAQAIRREFFAG